MIEANKLRPGMTFQENGVVFSTISVQNSQQGRGQALIKVKAKNLINDNIIIKIWSSGTKLVQARLEKKVIKYLYTNNQTIIFMDQVNFEQLAIPKEKISWEMNFITTDTKIIVKLFQTQVINLELPANVQLQVIEASDAVKGNTSTNPQKKVKLETNFELFVPMFIKTGQTILVTTKTGEYLGKTI